MKIGDTVNFYNIEDGKRRDAQVTALAGTGDSRKKVLHLQYADGDQDVKVRDVKHLDDAERRESFWLLKGDHAPRGWNEVPKPSSKKKSE